MFIYKIQHKTNPSLIYVGSTDDIDSRFIDHKSDCYNKTGYKYNHKIYQRIRENGGLDAFNFQVIDVLITKDKLVRRQLEQYYIDKFQSLKSMNTQNALHDNEEYQRLYYEEHRAEICVRDRLYREEHRAEVNAKEALYREKNRARINAKQNATYAFKMEAKRIRSIDV